MLQSLMPSLKELISADYLSVKTAESERIIGDSLKGLIPVSRPQLKQISGIPGAGKSTYCITHMPTNYLFLSFDKIMTSMSGYQKTLKAKGAEAAYEQYEMPARIIGYELLRRALNKKVNIMFEHSGTNNAHIEMFKNLPAIGYQTEADFIVCDTALAISRIQKRHREISRYVPESLVRERAGKFKDYMKIYKQIAIKTSVLDGANNFELLKKI